MASDQYKIEPASFFSLAIIPLYVTILHLFFITFQRLVDGISQKRQTENPPTSPGGVASENSEVLEESVGRGSNDETVPTYQKSNDDSQRTETFRKVTIELLPQDVLLEIFDVYRLESLERSQLEERPWEWRRLAHVCQRWRSILFASSRYLDLKVFCTYGTPVREVLSYSLDLPIIVRYGGFPGTSLLTANDEDAIIALLDHPTRIREVQLTATAPLLAILMQQPFSMLEYLHLSTRTEPGLVLPSEFGGTPRLRILRMVRVALPALPKLLLLAQGLVSLQLEELSNIGYTLEALHICLPSMTQLKTLRIHFHSPSFRPVLTSTLLSPERRSVIHCLNYLEFHGTSEHLESLLSTIRTPSLKYIHIAFFNQLAFHTPQLSQFILLTEMQRSPNQATIHYSGADISVTLSQPGMPYHLALRILSKQLDWQISSMSEICEELSQILSHVEQLNISASTSLLSGQDDMDLSELEFLELFRPFINVRRLHVTGESLSHLTCTFEPIAETGQLAVSVLPELREIYVGKHAELASAQRGLGLFIAARAHSTRSVVIRSLEPDPNRDPPTRGDPDVVPEVGVRGHLRRNPHLSAIRSLFQLEPYHLPPITQNDGEEAIDNLARLSQDLLDMHPSQESKVNLLQKLAFFPAFTSQLPGETARTITIPAAVLRSGITVLYDRLGREWWWATFARMWAHSSTAVAYQNTLSTLQSVLVTGLTTRLMHTFFGRLGPRLHIQLEYSSYLIERGQLELAVETIEQGKALIWSEMFGLRSSTRHLRRANPGLADSLAHFTEALEAINTLISENQLDADAFSLAFEELQGLLKGRQEVIQQIQALQGFANFMKTIPFRTLQTAAAQGPIIIINHCHWRCDILIVLGDSPPSLIPTNEGFYERACNLETRFKDAHKYGLDSQHYQRTLAFVLYELYRLVGQPVIDRLQELGIPEQSRIWWYPTSVFCSLPLHAMGPVLSTHGPEQYIFDLYVCSYTPTLGALIQSRRFLSSNPDLQHSLLLVAQPDDTAPGIREEMEIVQGLRIPVTTLSSAHATRPAIAEGLQNHTLVHFTSHGTLQQDPLDAGIHLYGGDRLTLRDIAHLRIPPAEFAFLSTCHTAESTDVGDFTEGLNIAAAMQYHGFGSVVGTSWAMVDTDGRDISKLFYRRLLARGGENHDAPLGERSARALRDTVQRLRRKKGITLQRWAVWVHYGA